MAACMHTSVYMQYGYIDRYMYMHGCATFELSTYYIVAQQLSIHYN